MVLSCEEYRDQQRLLALKKRLSENKLDPGTHRHYVQDDEYIRHGEDIEAFLKWEIAKPIIRWEDSPQLGYEILPNKSFYRYQPPTPAKELLEEFWRLEKDAGKMLEGLAQ